MMGRRKASIFIHYVLAVDNLAHPIDSILCHSMVFYGSKQCSMAFYGDADSMPPVETIF